MWSKFAAAMLAAVAVTSAPAYACMGPTVIYSDNFQSIDPAWTAMGATFSISNGHAILTALPGQFGLAFYGGKTIDSGDFCVDVTNPQVSDPSQAGAGIMFGMQASGDCYAFVATEDGQAGVLQLQNDTVLTPVAPVTTPLLRTGANATNTMRIVWKGTAGETFINNQPFATFTMQPLQNTFVGLMTDNGETAQFSYQFGNLKITNVP